MLGNNHGGVSWTGGGMTPSAGWMDLGERNKEGVNVSLAVETIPIDTLSEYEP